MSPASTITQPDLSPEVLAFAAEKGVTGYLPALIQLVQRIFPGRSVKVIVEDDPELSYNRTIVFQVDVGNMDPADYNTTTHAWYDGLFQSCPATHVHAFGLDPVFSS